MADADQVGRDLHECDRIAGDAAAGMRAIYDKLDGMADVLPSVGHLRDTVAEATSAISNLEDALADAFGELPPPTV